MNNHQLTGVSVEKRLADYQRRYDQAFPPEKHGVFTRVMRFTGEYGMLFNPSTLPIGMTQFAYQHRSNSRCVIDALVRSDARLKQLLVQKFDSISMDMILPVLKEIAKEVAIYVGGGAVIGGGVGALFGGVGAIPGAVAGAEAGFWLMNLLGLGKLLVYVASDALPQMVAFYTRGFAKAWRAGELPPTETAKRAQLMYSASEDFAHGHLKLLIAILTAIVVYLTKGQMKTLVAELNASKLGPKFGAWIEANESQLVKHPTLQPQKPLGQAVREAEEQAALRSPEKVPFTSKKKIVDGSVGEGETFDGTLYRAVAKEHDPLFIHEANIEALHRYTAKGQGGLYFATGKDIVKAEFENNGSTLLGKQMHQFENSSINGLLDLSNPATRRTIGVSLEDLTRTGGTKGWRYEATQPLGAWAHNNGYNGIIAPSAQADGGLNVILFGKQGLGP